MTVVTVIIDGRLIGKIAVNAANDVEPIQIATTAWLALSENAEFLVDGETFTTQDLSEFFA